MPEIDHRLGDRLRTLVAGEEPSPTMRSSIEERLRAPLPQRKPAPRVAVLAGVAAALVVGAVGLAGLQGSSGSDQRVSAVMPASGEGVQFPVAGVPHGRASTRVLISNATRTPGLADATLERLEAAGYIGVGSMDAPALATTSRVFFATGYEAEALDVARLLGLDESAVNRTPPAVPDPNGADVLVIVGTDLAGAG